MHSNRRFIPELHQFVNLEIDFCLKETAKQAINYAGIHGGYYNVPNPKVDYFWDELPYYAYKNESRVPSLGAIEQQISDFIKDMLPYCVKSLSFEGINVDGEIASVSSHIGNGSVLIRANYPISVKKGNSIKQLSDFSSK